MAGLFSGTSIWMDDRGYPRLDTQLPRIQGIKDLSNSSNTIEARPQWWCPLLGWGDTLQPWGYHGNIRIHRFLWWYHCPTFWGALTRLRHWDCVLVLNHEEYGFVETLGCSTSKSYDRSSICTFKLQWLRYPPVLDKSSYGWQEWSDSGLWWPSI